MSQQPLRSMGTISPNFLQLALLFRVVHRLLHPDVHLLFCFSEQSPQAMQYAPMTLQTMIPPMHLM